MILLYQKVVQAQSYQYTNTPLIIHQSYKNQVIFQNFILVSFSHPNTQIRKGCILSEIMTKRFNFDINSLMGSLVSCKLFSRSSKHQTMLFSIVLLHMLMFQLQFPFTAIASPFVAAITLWRYLLVVLLLYELHRTTQLLPTDPILEGRIDAQSCNQGELLLCVLCNSLVFRSSHHCFRCGKCAYEFDHHCKFLNCCIGGANYLAFLRLLFTFILYCVDTIVLVITCQNFQFKILHVTISLILGGLAFALLAFHIYLNCCLQMSTFQYLIPGLKKLQKLEQEIDSFKDQTRDK